MWVWGYIQTTGTVLGPYPLFGLDIPGDRLNTEIQRFPIQTNIQKYPLKLV
jgi:hypothetical protein